MTFDFRATRSDGSTVAVALIFFPNVFAISCKNMRWQNLWSPLSHRWCQPLLEDILRQEQSKYSQSRVWNLVLGVHCYSVTRFPLFGMCPCESKALELNNWKKEDFRLNSVYIDRRDLMGYWWPMATIDQCLGERGKGWNKNIYEYKKRKLTWLHRLNRGRIYFTATVWIRQILLTFQSLPSLCATHSQCVSVKVLRLFLTDFCEKQCIAKQLLP